MQKLFSERKKGKERDEMKQKHSEKPFIVS